MDKFFSIVPKGYSRVLEAKKTIFGGIYGMCLFEFLFIVALIIYKHVQIFIV
jgi:hypothetical protein